jgi:glutathione gamma-glutamylcysteinyltransferase
LADIAVDGITLAEFICLAQCNGLEGEAKSGGTTALEEFEADLQRVCSAPEANALMAVSYSRKTLGQTGDGHFRWAGMDHEIKA